VPQLEAHLPLLHTSLPVQAFPHPPQLLGSCCVSAQELPQTCWDAVQEIGVPPSPVGPVAVDPLPQAVDIETATAAEKVIVARARRHGLVRLGVTGTGLPAGPQVTCVSSRDRDSLASDANTFTMRS